MKNFIIRYILTLLLVIRAYTIGLFVPKYRKYIWLISINSNVGKLLGDSENELQFNLPVMSLGEEMVEYPARLLHPIGKDGNITTTELLILNYFIKKRNPQKVFEIGTFNGRTTINFAINTDLNSKIYTLDLPPDEVDKTKLNIEEVEKKFIEKNISGELYRIYQGTEKDKIIQLYGDSANFDFSEFNGEMDFIFIDGSHHYDYVKNDTEIALKMIRENGYIFWHDYNSIWPGVVAYLNEFLDNYPDMNIQRIQGTSLAYMQVTK